MTFETYIRYDDDAADDDESDNAAENESKDDDNDEDNEEDEEDEKDVNEDPDDEQDAEEDEEDAAHEDDTSISLQCRKYSCCLARICGNLVMRRLMRRWSWYRTSLK